MDRGSPSTAIRVLAVEPAGDSGLGLASQLADEGSNLAVTTATGVESARAVLSRERVDCVVCLHDPPAVDGVEVLAALRSAEPDLPVLFATEREHVDDVIPEGPTDVLQVADGRLHRGLVTHRIESVVSQNYERSTYEQIFQAASDGIVVHDPETGDVLDANRECYRILGLDPDDAGRLTVDAIGAGIDGYSAEDLRQLVSATLEDGSRTFEWSIDDAGGKPGWVEVTFEPAEIGGHARVLAFVRDVTERKQTEQRLRDRRETLRRLHEITARPGLTFEEQVDRLLAFGADQFDMEIAFLSETDPEAGDFEVVAARGDHELIQRGEWSPLSETYCRRLVGDDGSGTELIPDADETMAGDPAYEKFGLDCYVGTEVVVDGEVYGTLCFADGDPHRSSFTEEERLLLEIMGQWLSQELAGQSYREEAEDARTRLERILERVDDAFFAVDDDWQVTYVNEAGATVLREAMGTDYDEADLLGRHLWEEVPDAVGTAFYDAYHEAMATQKSVSFEAHYEPMDVWFEVNAYPDPGGLSVYFTDVTERKERERVIDDVLAASQAFHRVSDVDELVDTLMDSAADVFGYEHTIVRLYDEETDTLPAVHASQGDGILETYPVYDADEGVVGEVYRSGKSVVIDDLTDAAVADSYGPFESAMVISLERHGVFSVGAFETEAFSDEDAALVELLALTATSALDRLERERETRQLQRIVDHLDEMVFLLDEAGRFTFVSEQFATYLGRERSELVETPLSALVSHESADHFAGALAEVRDRPRSDLLTVEVDLATDEGTRPVELELSTVSVDDDSQSVAGIADDISELAETRGRLAAERDRFRELVENITDPVVEVRFDDGTPVVQYINDTFVDVFGYERDTAVGADLNALIVPPADETAARKLDERATDGEQTSVEVTRETTGGVRDFLLRGIPYERDGRTYGFAVYTDITDQKERERYLQVLNRVLRHNIRNDMNVVIGLGEQLASELDGSRRDRAETLLHNAREVAALGEKAREIEQVVSTRGEPGVVDAAALCRSVVEEQRDRFPSASVTVDLPPSLPVRGSATLGRAFEELVENGLEHNDAAEPTLRVDATVDDDAGTVALRVSDNGSGIPDEEWHVVTGETEITQLSHGSGLGLWLTRWIVDSSEGTVHRESGGEGTTVVVELELATPEERTAPQAED